MTAPREKADAEVREAIEDLLIGADVGFETGRYAIVDAILPLIAAREASLRADYEAVLADKRRLVRELDVALHGEAGAAKQASLCDLIEPAKALRAEIERLSAALAEATAANGERAQTTIDKIASITSAREASLRAERDQAVRALEGSGWTLTPGAAEWKPPLGKRPDFEQIDELRASLAATRAELAEARAQAFEDAAQIADEQADRARMTMACPIAAKIASYIRARAALEAKQ